MTMHKHAIRSAVPYGVVPFFQPIVGLSGSYTTLSYEALGRIAIGGDILSPGQFLSEFEGTPLMAEFDREVTAKSIAEVAVWNVRRSTPLHLHVNAGKENLSDLGYAHFLRELLTAHQLDPAFLTVEVVESCPFWREPEVLEVLQALRELGVNLAVDDFPCWEDPSALLGFLDEQTVEFSTLKLDRSLVMALGKDDMSNSARREMVGYIRQVRALGMGVVAEGVENIDHVQLLQSLGVQAVQGFAIGRPQPAQHAHHLTEGETTSRVVPIPHWSTRQRPAAH